MKKIKLSVYTNGVLLNELEREIIRSSPIAPCDHRPETSFDANCNMVIQIPLSRPDQVYGHFTFNDIRFEGTITSTGLELTIPISTLQQFCVDGLVTYYFYLFNVETGMPICETTYFWTFECPPPCCEGIKTGKITDKTDQVTISGKKYRANVEIWCRDGLFVSDVGSLTRVKVKRFGGWFKTNVDEVAASFEGTIQDGEDNPCPDIDIPYLEETEIGNGHVERNIDPPTDDPRYYEEQNKCRSTHWFRLDGTTISYTQNGGYLYLN